MTDNGLEDDEFFKLGQSSKTKKADWVAYVNVPTGDSPALQPEFPTCFVASFFGMQALRLSRPPVTFGLEPPAMREEALPAYVSLRRWHIRQKKSLRPIRKKRRHSASG